MVQKQKSALRRFLAPLLLAVGVPLLLFLFSGLLGEKASGEGLRIAEEGIRRAAVQCYALEGFYPPTLDYLTRRYGVNVDSTRYFVDYQYVAANLVPDITVLPVG
ncbi:MAG TPA: hypothetical protein PK597_00860 [Oscillospiraceae bacterium]|nr:hypothetical protein [Oscillospiraceae bacterium]